MVIQIVWIASGWAVTYPFDSGVRALTTCARARPGTLGHALHDLWDEILDAIMFDVFESIPAAAAMSVLTPTLMWTRKRRQASYSAWSANYQQQSHSTPQA